MGAHNLLKLVFYRQPIFNDISCCLAELNFLKSPFSLHYTNKSRRTTLLFYFFLLCTIRYQSRQKSAIGYLKLKKKIKKTFNHVSHVKSITSMRSAFLRPIAIISKTLPQEQKARWTSLVDLKNPFQATNLIILQNQTTSEPNSFLRPCECLLRRLRVSETLSFIKY